MPDPGLLGTLFLGGESGRKAKYPTVAIRRAPIARPARLPGNARRLGLGARVAAGAGSGITGEGGGGSSVVWAVPQLGQKRSERRRASPQVGHQAIGSRQLGQVGVPGLSSVRQEGHFRVGGTPEFGAGGAG